MADIRTSKNPLGWDAIDADTYDGAPDSGPRARCIGMGKTEQAAIDDLMEQLAEVRCAERIAEAKRATT